MRLRSHLVLTLAGCVAGSTWAAEPATEHPLTALPYAPSLDVTAMDRSTDPCDDLFTYSCGGWQRRNPIPKDQDSWSVYRKVFDENQHYLWGILQSAARSDPKRSAAEQKIGDYFAACMDEAAVEQAGMRPIQPYM